jgi:hypothetical protein
MGHIDQGRDAQKQDEYRRALERDIEIKKARMEQEKREREAGEWWEGKSSKSSPKVAPMQQQQQQQQLRMQERAQPSNGYFQAEPDNSNGYRPQTVGEGRRNQLGGSSMAELMGGSPDRRTEQPMHPVQQRGQSGQAFGGQMQHQQPQKQQLSPSPMRGVVQPPRQHLPPPMQQRQQQSPPPRQQQPPPQTLDEYVDELEHENAMLRRRLQEYESRYGPLN